MTQRTDAVTIAKGILLALLVLAALPVGLYVALVLGWLAWSHVGVIVGVLIGSALVAVAIKYAKPSKFRKMR